MSLEFLFEEVGDGFGVACAGEVDDSDVHPMNLQ
jgi:hypothetical protein